MYLRIYLLERSSQESRGFSHKRFKSYDVLHILSSRNACEDLKKYYKLVDKYKSILSVH